MKRPFLVAAVLLVVAANAVVLARVAWNRAGQPDATLVLTERELRTERSWSDENSGVALGLVVNAWRPGAGKPARWSRPTWLTGDALDALGFDTAAVPTDVGDARRFAQNQPSRPAYAVLQYGGSAWEDWLKAVDAEAAKGDKYYGPSPAQERLEGTRLFLVDAGPDPDALRAEYPSRAAYLVLPARASVTVPWDCKANECALIGDLDLVTDVLVVPHRLAGALPAKDRRPGEGPRYRVVLRAGSRREPWIESIGPLAEER